MRAWWLSIASLVLPVASIAAAPQTADEVRKCMQQNFPKSSSVQSIEVKAADRSGGSRTLAANVYWKRAGDGKAQVMLRVKEPADLKDSSYLVLERSTRDDMFMFLPAANRVRRIQGAQVSDGLWGTDFSYDDMRQVQGILDSGKFERQKDEDFNGRKVYVLAVAPAKAEESSYNRIMSYVDQQTCVPLKTEFFQKAGAPRKRLLVDPAQVTQQGSQWIAHQYDMTDLLSQTATQLRIGKVEYEKKLPERLFNQQTFYLGE